MKGLVLLRADGMYWGINAKTGEYGWCWAPSLALVYPNPVAAANDSRLDPAIIGGAFQVSLVEDPVSGR